MLEVVVLDGLRGALKSAFSLSNEVVLAMIAELTDSIVILVFTFLAVERAELESFGVSLGQLFAPLILSTLQGACQEHDKREEEGQDNTKEGVQRVKVWDQFSL